MDAVAAPDLEIVAQRMRAPLDDRDNHRAGARFVKIERAGLAQPVGQTSDGWSNPADQGVAVERDIRQTNEFRAHAVEPRDRVVGDEFGGDEHLQEPVRGAEVQVHLAGEVLDSNGFPHLDEAREQADRLWEWSVGHFVHREKM
jgi:hypothetical protein